LDVASRVIDPRTCEVVIIMPLKSEV